MSVRARGVGYGLLALVAGSTVALGQTGQIRVERKIGAGSWTVLSNTAPGLGNPITVDINQGSPTIPANTNVFIRVYDTDPTTLDDIGQVTMAGAMPAGSGRVKVAVWRRFTQDFPTSPFNSLLPDEAGGSWGGLSFNSLQEDADADWLGRKLPQTNIDLLRRTDLAASIRDNLVGSIDVGRVFTLQVNGVLQPDGSVVGGNIDAEVRAYEEDIFAANAAFDDAPLTAAIEYVRAGNRITRGVIAADSSIINTLLLNVNTLSNVDVGIRTPPAHYVGPAYFPVEGQLADLVEGVQPNTGNWLRRGASIRRVVVGPSIKAQGVVNQDPGNPFTDTGIYGGAGLFAPTGRIYRVNTTGPILSADVNAGFGAYVFRMTDESGSQVVTPTFDNSLGLFKFQSFTANKYFTLTQASIGFDDPQPATFNAYYPGFSALTGAVNLIETGGDLEFPASFGSGQITPAFGRMANLTGLGNEAQRANSRGLSGIIVGGNLANVDIRYNLLYANVLASNIRGLSIGKAAIGAIVAHGDPAAGNGNISELNVYAGRFLQSDPDCDGNGIGRLSIDPYPLLENGLLAAGVEPLDMRPLTGTAEYDREVWLRVNARDFGPGAGVPGSGGAIDSVIRAENTISKSQILRTTQARGTVPYGGESGAGTAYSASAYRPRVEAPLISTTRIGQVEGGVVWSGKLNYAAPGVANADRSDDYARFVLGEFFSIGPSADVWVAVDNNQFGVVNTLAFNAEPLFFDPLCIDSPYRSSSLGGGSIFGELHLPHLESFQAVGVANGLLTAADATQRSVRSFALASSERSPRGLRFVSAAGAVEPSSEADGIIRVLRSTPAGGSAEIGLDGQISLRFLGDPLADTNPAAYWKGRVEVGDPITSPSTVITLSPNASLIDDLALGYGRTSATLASSDAVDGGSVGVSAVLHHKEDSLPPVLRTSSLAVPPLATQYGFVSSRSWLSSSGQQNDLRVRFYGPIEKDGFSPGEIGVRVEASPVADFSSSVTDVTDAFTSEISGNVFGLQRDLVLRPVCTSAYDTSLFYRAIRNADSALQPPRFSGVFDRAISGFIGQAQREVAQFAHYFRIGARADVAGANQSVGPDGNLTADDIIVFLGWYFAGDPRGDVAGPNQSPIPDGNFTADDVIVFFGWYFAGPGEVIPATCLPLAGRQAAPQSAMRGAAQPESIAGNGGASGADRIAAMQAMIAAESDPQRRAALQTALQILQLAPSPSGSPAPAMDER